MQSLKERKNTKLVIPSHTYSGVFIEQELDFFMFLFKVLSGTVSYLDIFVLIHWWFANIWLYTLSSLSPSLTSLHGVNSKLVPRKFQLRAVTMLPSG
jgi:hypothetical protein